MAARTVPKTTTDDVVRLCRGELVVVFSYEEWVCVRHIWKSTGQPLGAIVPLFDSERDALGAEGLDILRAMLSKSEANVLPRELQSSSNGDELFELVKRTWKVPYRKITDSGDRVYKGTRLVGNFGDPAAPAVPAYGELPVYRAAFEKLRSLATPAGGDLEIEVIGLRFMEQRVRAGLA